MSWDYSTATFSLKTTLQRGNKFLTKLFAKYGQDFYTRCKSIQTNTRRYVGEMIQSWERKTNH